MIKRLSQRAWTETWGGSWLLRFGIKWSLARWGSQSQRAFAPSRFPPHRADFPAAAAELPSRPFYFLPAERRFGETWHLCRLRTQQLRTRLHGFFPSAEGTKPRTLGVCAHGRLSWCAPSHLFRPILAGYARPPLELHRQFLHLTLGFREFARGAAEFSSRERTNRHVQFADVLGETAPPCLHRVGAEVEKLLSRPQP